MKIKKIRERALDIKDKKRLLIYSSALASLVLQNDGEMLVKSEMRAGMENGVLGCKPEYVNDELHFRFKWINDDNAGG